jgi:hypothetical protein
MAAQSRMVSAMNSSVRSMPSICAGDRRIAVREYPREARLLRK